MFSFERVHTMTDFYDGPRGGIADYEGQAHVYQSVVNELEGYTDIFRLSPVSQDLFLLALEDWRIWLRWEAAFHQRETSSDTHPALPEDQKRHEILDAILEGQLVVDESNCIIAHGEFRLRDELHWSGYGFRPLEVKWSRTE
jgi:hypothetical protein